MTDVITQTCTSCGAEIYGTKFCESCGATTSAKLVAEEPSAALAAEPATTTTAQQPASIPMGTIGNQVPSTTPRGATALRIITLLFLCATLLAPAIISMLPTSGLGDAQRGTVATLECFVGLFALLAAVTGNANAGAKLGGALFALGYVALTMTEEFTSVFYTGAFTYQFADAGVYLLLFLCWAVSRPFRGPGYFGILFLIAFEFANAYIAIGIYGSAGTSAPILIALIDVALILATIGFSALFERRPAAQPVASVVQMDGAPNGKARTSLILALVALGLNALSQFIPYQIGVAISVCAFGMLIAAIIVGHLARREIRVTNQRGRGLALAGLLIGYSSLGIDAAIILVAVVAIAAIGSSY